MAVKKSSHRIKLLLALVLLILTVSFAFSSFERDSSGMAEVSSEFKTLENSSQAQPQIVQQVTKPITGEIATIEQIPPQIRVLAFGDMMLGRYVRILMDRHGLDYPFEGIRKGIYFPNFDLVFANLEGPVTVNPVYSSTSMVFGFPPDTAEIVKRNGYNLVTIANNHMFDRGENAYGETKKFLDDLLIISLVLYLLRRQNVQ